MGDAGQPPMAAIFRVEIIKIEEESDEGGSVARTPLAMTVTFPRHRVLRIICRSHLTGIALYARAGLIQLHAVARQKVREKDAFH